MELFSSQLSDNEKKDALALVNHLQTMVAYQQLAMEIYNDALESATGVKVPWLTEVGLDRSKQLVYDSKPVVQYIIPALEKKIEIYQLMETKHREASILAIENFHQPYQEMTAYICALMERAQLMLKWAKKWVNYEVLNFDSTSIDENERTMAFNAVISLNELVTKIGLTPEELLDILLKSMNTVRAYIKLSPLEKDVYISKCSSAFSGEIVRYYSD